MTHEQEKPPTRLSRAQAFGLTEREELFDRVRHERLLGFLTDAATTVHHLEESYNNYGEFLFVTLSRPGPEQRILITFWGAGYHEYRERWLADEWFFYYANAFPETEAQDLDKEEVQEAIAQRREYVQANASQDTQTRHGQLFEMLADLTDEDGAYSEIEDLPGWLFDEGGEGFESP